MPGKSLLKNLKHRKLTKDNGEIFMKTIVFDRNQSIGRKAEFD